MANDSATIMQGCFDHDYRHPERQQKDLIWAPDGNRPAAYKALRAAQGRPSVEENYSHEDHPCFIQSAAQNVSLTPKYGPVGSRRAVDATGRANDASASNDFITQQFLRAQPDLAIGTPDSPIPLVAEMLALSGPDDLVRFTLMRHARGKRLDNVWPSLSPVQKAGFVRQVAAIITALRRFTAPTAQKVDGSLLDDPTIGHCLRRRAPSCTKIGPTSDAWIDALAPTLRSGLSRLHQTNDPAIIDTKLAELRANFPPGGPYHLTHGYLNMSNIIVQDDKITAILDWEIAGYYPWWAERWLFIRTYSPGDELFDPVWALLEPELTHEKMRKDVYSAVGQVISAWQKCNVEHPGEDASWLRPAFSKCEPYSGFIKWRDCGNQLEHNICDIQWGAEKSNYPYNNLYNSNTV